MTIDTVTSAILAEVQRLEELDVRPDELYLDDEAMLGLKHENGRDAFDPDPDEFFGLKVKRMPSIVVTSARPYLPRPRRGVEFQEIREPVFLTDKQRGL